MRKPFRRQFLGTLATLLGSGLLPPLVQGEEVSGCSWPAWENFRNWFVQQDGRVIDQSANAHSTSEGQAYALFFALIAGDRASFDRILTWTRDNLASGDLTSRLLAWQWGKKPDGSWGVLDANAASDADLWLSYTLFQAARQWQDKKLLATATLLAERISRELVVEVAGVGSVLLPGPQGFALDGGGYKLNPSYQPLFLLKALAVEHPTGPWHKLARSTVQMLEAVTPQRMAPDWVAVHPGRGFVAGRIAGCNGSYDAIRVYLWAGLTSAHDPDRVRLIKRLTGYTAMVERLGTLPERIDACVGGGQNNAPLGFSAALLPFLEAIGNKAVFEQQRLRIIANGGIPKIYYEQALALFSDGWLDKRYRFEDDGRLSLSNKSLCKN